MDIRVNFQELQDSPNIAELLDEEQLRHIGGKVVSWYEADKESRAEWEKRTKSSFNLALQVMETKSYPWQNASNVKFPLLTIASLQFSARVYPTLVKTPDIAKMRVMGKDPMGQKAARAMRVGKFMSYQLLEESEEWEEEQDRLFVVLPILGCAFKKTYYDQLEDKVKSKLVLPQDLVLHYWTKDLSRSRVTETFELYVREIRERQLRGLYLDADITQFEQGSSHQRATDLDADNRQGISPPFADEDTPREVLECHCFFDLDGDGYEEPYVVTVDRESRLPLRILNRFQEIVSEQSLEVERIQKQNYLIIQSMPGPEQFNQLPEQQQQQVLQQIQQLELQIQENNNRIEELLQEEPDIIRIVPKVYYTKYSFIPAPDGGYYDLGFGQLLGPLNESVNTLINQLIDAGTMQNGNSGFIAKGARIQGGSVRFEPFEWKRVATSGQSLKDSIVPLPVNQPSEVLFQLLGTLISYAERVSSVSDVMAGENPGQNTPAYNMQAMVEQGMQVFNGIFKRIYRAFRSELRKIYQINGEYIDVERYVETLDGEFRVLSTDFQADSKDLLPAADPNSFSNMEKVMKAQFLSTRAQQVPGYNTVEVEKRLLEAMDVNDFNEVFPTTPEGKLAIPPPPNPEIEIERSDMQRRVLEGKVRGEVDMMKAESDRMYKEAQSVKAMAEAGAVSEEIANERLKMLDEHQKRQHEQAMARIDEYMKELDLIVQSYKVEEAEAKADQVKKKAKESSETSNSSSSD